MMWVLHKIRRHWLKLLMVLIAGVAIYGFGIRHSGLTIEKLTEYARNLPVGGLMVALVILPILGVPISPFLIICGVRFGFLGGAAVASAAISFHQIVAFYLVHGKLRTWMGHYLTRKGYKIPTPAGKNQVAFTLLFVGVQGPPYAVKLYLLALTEVPFRIYFWLGLPIYVLFALIPIAAGSSVMSMNTLWLYVGVFGVMGIIVAIRWLRSRAIKPS